MKKLIALLLLGAVSVGTINVAIANEDERDTEKWPLSIYVNREPVNFPDATPFVDENARTQVPVRFVSEALSANVEWLGATRQVRITKEEQEILLTLDVKEMTVDGETKVLDSAPLIKDDRTFVPIRFVSEALGASISWDADTNTVFISTAGSISSEEPSGRIPVGTVDLNGVAVDVTEKDEGYRDYLSAKVYKESGAFFSSRTNGELFVSILEGTDVNLAYKEIEAFLKQKVEPQNVEKLMELINKYHNKNEFYLEELTDACGVISFGSGDDGVVSIRILKGWSEE